MEKLIQNTPTMTGNNNAACQPAGTIAVMEDGNLDQTNANTKVLIGIIITTRNTADKLPSISGASQRPARKPRITVGSACIISMSGLIFCWRAPAIKYAVKIAAIMASGAAIIIV